MAYTLADYSKLAKDPLQAGVVDILRAGSPIMDAISWENTGTLKVEIPRMKTLPTIGTRKIGASWSETKGLIDLVEDRLCNVGAYIDIDKILLRAQTVTDQKALQISMFVKAMALKFNSLFISGTPSADYDGLTGIRYRIANYLAASQSIAGASLDISPDATNLSTNQTQFIDKLHELCNVCGYGDGGPTHLIMNRTALMRTQAALRWAGSLKTTEDNYGRTFDTFGEGGPALIDIGTTDPLDLTATIIGNVENADGNTLTGGACTTIFAVKIGGPEYLNGFQLYGPETNDVGMLESGVAERVVVDWPLGIYHVSPFSMARLHGIVAA